MSLFFSFALGAILAFAVHRSPAEVSLQVVGVVGFVTSLYFARWRRRIVEESVEHRVAPPTDVDGSILYEDGTWRGLPDRPQEHEIIIREPPRADGPAGRRRVSYCAAGGTPGLARRACPA